MEVNEIKAHIQKKQFNSFYIFTGPEWKIQRIYIDMIAKASGKELAFIDSITDIYGKLNNRSFLSKSYVYVVRDDKELMQNEKLQSQLDSVLSDNILILELTEPDKRTKFYRAYKNTIAEFNALTAQITRKYIQREIQLSDKNCDKLAEICEYDYGRCLLEINKVKMYAGSPEADIDLCFEGLIKNGTIYTPPKDAIFDFVDAVLDDKIQRSFDLYQNCVAVGEAVMVMISVLYNNAKAVLQVQSCKSSDVSKATGLTAWQIQNARKHLNVYSIGELVRIMKLCQVCQEAIVTGTMDEEYAMDYILTEVL